MAFFFCRSRPLSCQPGPVLAAFFTIGIGAPDATACAMVIWRYPGRLRMRQRLRLRLRQRGRGRQRERERERSMVHGQRRSG